MATGVIRTAIYEYFTNDDLSALYLDINGRMYYSEADEDADRPYCVFHIYQTIPERTFDLSFEDMLVQFDYYAKTANQCDDGLIDIRTMYDWADLDITGYTCLRMEWVTTFPSEKEEPSGDWVGSVRYRLFIQDD